MEKVMKITRNHRVYMTALVLAICMLFAACKAQFQCDFCGKNSSGEKYDLTNLGRGYVCEGCYDLLWGRGR